MPEEKLDKMTKAVVQRILDSDPDEMAVALAIDIIDIVESMQNEQHKIAVVGQILVEGSETPRIVVLGPFGARGKLETLETWEKAAQSHTASRTEGGKLAFRSTVSPSTARGRYLLAPVFGTAAKAWKFFPDAPATVEEIEEEFRSIRGVVPEETTGPACQCGLLGSPECHRHPNGRPKK